MLTSQPPKELRELLSELVDGQLDAHGLRRLEEILRTSPESQTFYDSFMTLHGMLLWGAGPPLSAVPSRTDLVSVADPQSQAGDFPPPPPSGLLGAAWHGATGYLSNHDFVLPYSISAVLIGIAMWVSSMIYVSHHVQVARVEPTPVRSDSHKEIVLIGRITGMVDVKWSDDPRYLPPPDFAHVPLGRKYILDAGLLEITYDSGAKVILEGPCTYEVESTAGGYLALGKLTARVGEDKETKRQGDKGKKADAASPHLLVSQSPGLPVSPLFSVRTPTALVTDLGTEFGVKVDEQGVTRTHVFVGKVRLASTAPSGKAGEGRVLSAGQSGIVQSGNAAIVVASDDGEKTFARVMPPPKDVQKARADAYADLVMSLGPVAYYRMERSKAGENKAVVRNSVPGGYPGKLHWKDWANQECDRAYVFGRFGDSLWLRGSTFGDYMSAPRPPDSDTNQYSFSAWVLAESRPREAPIAVDSHRRPYRLKLTLCENDGDLFARVAHGGNNNGLPLTSGATRIVREGRLKPFPVDQWQHVAVVADGSAIHLYRNGVEVASTPCDGVIASPPGTELLIGRSEIPYNPLAPGLFWDGRIDEVAVFNRALIQEEVFRLFEGPTDPFFRKTTVKTTAQPSSSTAQPKGGDSMNDP